LPDTLLRIAKLRSGPDSGLIGITFAPGKKGRSLRGGYHDRDLDIDLDVVAAWGAAAVVTLIEETELQELEIWDLEKEVRRRFMEWHHLPIRDVSVPDAAFERSWIVDAARLQALLDAGANVLIHCRGGLGRAGMVAARLLVERGVEPDAAMREVRAVRPGAIETPDQEHWVRQGSKVEVPAPGRGTDAIRDRAMGALVGLAVGDAVGTTIEFSPKPHFATLSDMVGGGQFRLNAGEWTDDTALALALADSLLAHPDLDPADLMTRFVDWYRNGTYSCTGTCFDIGHTTSSALDHFTRTGDPIAGSTDPRAAGNGGLMRLSPVAIRHWRDRDKLKSIAMVQTRTTHGAAEAIEASALFADILADAIAGRTRTEILAPRAGEFSDKIAAIANGGPWRGRHRDDIIGTGYVCDCLNAALWSVSRTTDFRSAILLAVNLGEDADTTAAVAGQLAGALYGLSGIPEEWLQKLAWRERIEGMALALFEAGAAGEPQAAHGDQKERV
jgi:ADP-ribosyl-[dinitrogen reductase] hydrolase